MDSSQPFVVRFKIHSNKEEWPIVTFVSSDNKLTTVIILCFIYVHNAISDAHIIYGSATLLKNIRI